MHRARRVAVAGVIVWSTALMTACASEDVAPDQAAKAAALDAALAPLGRSVTPRVAATLFGTDGGFVCQVAREGDDLTAAGLLTSHRFALRRLEVTPEDVAFLRAVVQVYCPEAAATFAARLADLSQGEGP